MPTLLPETFEFDFEGARSEGFSSTQIVDALKDLDGLDFDVDAARGENFSDDEIAKVLETGSGFDRSAGEGAEGMAVATGKGVVRGATDLATLGGAVAGSIADVPDTVRQIPAMASAIYDFFATGGKVTPRASLSFEDGIIPEIDIGFDASAGQRPTPEQAAELTDAPNAKALAATVYGLPEEASERIFGEPGVLTYRNYEDLPPEQRAFAVAGETMGGAIPFTALFMTLSRLGLSAGQSTPINRFVSDAMEFARRKPGTFAAAETGAILGASQGAAVAELVAPGDELTRMGFEALGSFANPAALTMGAARGAASSLRQKAQELTPEGRNRVATQYVLKLLDRYGGDPDALKAGLRAGDEMGITKGLSSGQRLDPQTPEAQALLALEKDLMRDQPARSQAYLSRLSESLETARRITDTIASTGDPALMPLLAKKRKQQFDNYMEIMVGKAERDAAAAGARVGIPDAETARAANVEGFEIADRAMRVGRAVESKLWGAVEKDVPVGIDNFARKLNDIAEEIGNMPPELQPFLNDVQKMMEQATPVLSGQLLKARSKALGLQRRARAAQKFDIAKDYGEVAASILDDLDTVGTVNSVSAREFSRSFNDHWTRSFAGDALATKATGANKINPESMLDRALAGEGTQAATRMRDLENAVAFSEREGRQQLSRSDLLELNGDDLLAPFVHNQQTALARVARKVMDPATNTVDPKKLREFADKNQSLLVRYPELRGALEDASVFQQQMQMMQRVAHKGSERVRRMNAFGKLIDFENPAQVLSVSLGPTSKTPLRDYDSLVALARRADRAGQNGSPYTAGLRATTLDYAINQGHNGGKPFWVGFSEALTRPLGGRGAPTLLDHMVAKKVMPSEMAERLKKIMERAIKLEANRLPPGEIANVVGAPGAFENLMQRISGAKAGSTIANALGGGGSIIAPAAGSSFFQKILAKMPIAKTRDVLHKMVEDPQFLADLLEAAPANVSLSVRERIRAARVHRIHSALWGSGLTALAPGEE